MQAAVALVVLAAGVLTAADQRAAPRAPRALPSAVTLPGVQVTAQVVEEQEYVARLALQVAVGGESTGRGDTGGPSEPEQLRLVDLAARGFSVRLRGRATPLVLGPTGRFGSGLPYVVPLDVDVVVVDCSVEVGAPRRITAAVRRGEGATGSVGVDAGPEVVRALDDLVRRTCRRPRG